MKQADLEQIKSDVAGFLDARHTPDTAFGKFSQCAHAFVPDEVSALGAALELWIHLSNPDQLKTYVLRKS
jgi:hypothetical protein